MKHWEAKKTQAIEDAKQEPDLEENVKDGTHSIHTNILVEETGSMEQMGLTTNVEIQMVRKPFGATLMIQIQDGSTAILFHNNMVQLLVLL